VVKLFEQFVKENLVGEYINEKMGLPTIAKLAADEMVNKIEKDLRTKRLYTKTPKPYQANYVYPFDEVDEKDLIEKFGADGIIVNVTLELGPTLFKKDTYTEANTYDAPQQTTNGKKMVLVNIKMWMDMEVHEKDFAKGAESAVVEIKSILYHELTHSNEFERRKKNGAYVATKKDRSELKGSQYLQSMITQASEKDVPYFFTRFFQLIYIATSYETNAFAAMVVADMERHTFKKREDFDSLKDYILSQHDTLVKRQEELIQTNSWRNYMKLKEFSIADFIKNLESYGMPFEKFFKALTAASNDAAVDVIRKTINIDPRIRDDERKQMLKSMDDTIALLRAQKTSDPIDQMRAVANKITAAKEKLGKKLMRMVTYE